MLKSERISLLISLKSAPAAFGNARIITDIFAGSLLLLRLYISLNLRLSLLRSTDDLLTFLLTVKPALPALPNMFIINNKHRA